MTSRLPDLQAAKQRLMQTTAAHGRAIGNAASALRTWNAANSALGVAIARGCRPPTAEIDNSSEAEWVASQLLQAAQDREKAAERALESARRAYEMARIMNSTE